MQTWAWVVNPIEMVITMESVMTAFVVAVDHAMARRMFHRGEDVCRSRRNEEDFVPRLTTVFVGQLRRNLMLLPLHDS